MSGEVNMNSVLKKILESIEMLNHGERVIIENALHAVDDFQTVCDLIEKSQETEPHCPHCSHTEIGKFGRRSGLQRYRCKSCLKTFNALTNTPFAHLRKKELWLTYTAALSESKTVRKAAEELHISKNTSFRWRHRFTELMSRDIPKELNGIIEADETYFRFSMKGSHHLERKSHKRGGGILKPGLSTELVSVFTACDRSRQDIEAVTGFGQVSGEWLVKHFSRFVPKDAILVTDSMKSYDYLCRKKHIAHVHINKKQINGVFHIQHVNSYHKRLKEWIIGGFHGVATKYLRHYLSWRHELEKSPKPDRCELFMAAIGQINH